MKELVCPFCGSNISVCGESTYFCNDCGVVITEEEITRWDYIHKISSLLMDTDENNIVYCHIIIGEDEAVGLSTLEMPTICKIYQQQGEGIIWFQYYGEEEWHELDSLSTNDIKEVFEWLSYNDGFKSMLDDIYDLGECVEFEEPIEACGYVVHGISSIAVTDKSGEEVIDEVAGFYIGDQWHLEYGYNLPYGVVEAVYKKLFPQD